MELAKIDVSKTTGICRERRRIPAGIVGGTVSVRFTDPVWDDMTKTVVFRGVGSRIAEFDGQTAVIPWEVLTEPGKRIYFGVYGSNLDTGVQLPLIEVSIGITERSVDPEADPGTDPTLPIWAQLQQDVEDLRENLGEQVETSVKDYLEKNPPSGGNTDLTGYATEVWVQEGYQPKGEYLTEVPEGYAKIEDIPTKAEDIGALPDTYTPPDQTAEQVGADPKGTAESKVSEHSTDTAAHNDIRLELKAINDRLTAFFDSDDQTLDELSEIVAYITSNKTLIESITTSKVSVTDIIDNLTTNVANKPLSAAQGVVLKGLIDTLSNSLSGYQPKGDYALRAELPTVPTKVSAFTNDAGYLTEHQDISGKLDADKLPEAVNDALAQAKESGEFDGNDGTSITHEWNGTVLSVTSASGTSTADLKGDKGDKGDTGDTGPAGPQGTQGETGAAGYTPVKGTDYYTEADKTEMVNRVIAGLTAETWTFTLEDDSTVSKVVLLK